MSQKQPSEQELLARISELESELKKSKPKKYGLVWEEHQEDVVLQCQNNVPILKEVKNRKVSDNTNSPTNVLIEGDNYHALSVLNYTHKGKIDVIYIDPPYNTGNKDFIYNDNYIDREDSYRHSKWLSFMEKRLKLAKQLLSESGVIFISIDGNELTQLKLLNDEVFGFNNFISIISVVNNLKGRSDDKHIATANEFLLIYANNSNYLKINGFNLDQEKIDEYDKKDGYGLYKEIGFRKTGKGWRMEDRPNMYYPIYFNPQNNKISLDKFVNSIEIYPLTINGEKGRWRWGKETFLEKYIKDIVIKRVKKDKYSIFTKMRIGDEDGNERTLTPKSFWLDPKYDTSRGSDTLLEVFGIRDIFTNPKPISFIKDILHISTNKSSIVLDFMAGSGTTGHAVMELNKEDGGNRQFILCTNNENNICEEVTYERLKRVMKGYKNKKGEKVKGLGGNLRYFKTELFDVGKISRVTDDKKLALTYRVGGLLALKENTFEEVENTDHWQIFREHDKSTAVYFSEDKTKLHELITELGSYDVPVKLYVFSWSKNEYASELSEYPHIAVLDIPEPILAVYREINNL